MRPEIRLVKHVRRGGDEKSEIRKGSAASSAILDLAQYGIGAQAQRVERRMKVAMDCRERCLRHIGDRNGDKLMAVRVAELQSLTARVRPEFCMGLLVDLVV